MNDEELDALRHAQDRSNGWVLAEPDSDLHKVCESLAARGEFALHGPVDWCAGEIAYRLTDAGRSALLHELRARGTSAVPLTTSQQRYQDYCKVGDLFGTFGDYLRYLAKEKGMKGTAVRERAKKRKSISVRGTTYERLFYFALCEGRSVSSLVEEWIAERIPADLDVPEKILPRQAQVSPTATAECLAHFFDSHRDDFAGDDGLDHDLEPAQKHQTTEPEPEVQLEPVTDEDLYFPGLSRIKTDHQDDLPADGEESETRGGGVVML